MFVGVIGFAMIIFCIGTYVAAREASMFIERFRGKVRLHEINGISMEDLEDGLKGKRIFWMGEDYEKGKQQQGCIEALKAATPDATRPEEIDVPALGQALKDADEAGVENFKMPGDSNFGKKAMARATNKLQLAMAVQAGDESAAEAEVKIKEEEEEVDFDMKLIEEEMQAAQAKGNDALARMCQLAALKQLDSFKVGKKLLDKQGRVLDELRALYLICEAKGILHSYHQASRSFSRRIVKWSHAIPFYRLTEFGWQPSVASTDFAGILNANGLWSFTVGVPQVLFSVVFIISAREHVAAPCENDAALQCTLTEDFGRPNVQNVIVFAALFIDFVSLAISIANIVVDFPAQIFKIAEEEEELLRKQLLAEAATKKWEDKLAKEVQDNIKDMLKMSTQFESNATKGMESAMLVIDDVMDLEKAAGARKLGYIEYFMKQQ